MREDFDSVPWLTIILWCIAVGIVVFLMNWMGWISFAFWTPKYEDTHREVFKHSVAHIEGKQQQLVRLWGEWKQSDENQNHQSALCAVARHEASTLEPQYIPSVIKNWECVK